VSAHVGRLAWTLLAAGVVLAEYGFFNPITPIWVLRLIAFGALMAYGLELMRCRRRDTDPFVTPRTPWLEGAAGITVLFCAGMYLSTGNVTYWRCIDAACVGFFLLEAWRLNVTLSRALARPGLLLPISFATLILVGSVLLMTPRATPHVLDATGQSYISTGTPLTFGEALFTATSAVCVTGLTVRNTAQDFSPFGQTVIAFLIQLGGLGIIIFGSMLATLLGQSLSLKENLNLREMLNDHPLHRVRGFVRFIVLSTIGLELIGAAAMYPVWDNPDGGVLTVSERVGMSLFHAVSALCNAGFDITGDSLVAYRYRFVSHTVIVALIVVGGLGFPALENLFSVARVRLGNLFRYRPVRPGVAHDLTAGRLSLHTKIVLTATLCLYLWGLLLIGAGQLMPYLHDPLRREAIVDAAGHDPLTMRRLGGIVADAHFMSVTSRTAGFNTMPMSDLEPAGRVTVMTLMMVGGSPGSTAGGFKTTVIALLILSVVATVRQRPRAEAFGRTIADALVRKAAAIGICYILLVTVATILLCLSEPFPFQSLAFEAVSATTTTGLSLGITGDLTGFGRGVIIACMFLGRVGPLALIGAMTFGGGSSQGYRYAYEDVAIG
jgi:trk system potassium uptake protein TrkH